MTEMELENTCESIEGKSLIASLTPKSVAVDVIFKIIHMEKKRVVKARTSGRLHYVADAVVADSSAKITLTLWNDDADALVTGRTYLLKGGYISVFDRCMRLTRSRAGEFLPAKRDIEYVNDSVDMSRPFAGEKPSRRRHRSSTGRTFHGSPRRESRGYCGRKEF
ncbi:MAG: hypothetical protein ACW97A_06330 [Candidatus Thorarchaeota archaeon]|jgi:ssDNA-binding replication factor A large subunit